MNRDDRPRLTGEGGRGGMYVAGSEHPCDGRFRECSDPARSRPSAPICSVISASISCTATSAAGSRKKSGCSEISVLARTSAVVMLWLRPSRLVLQATSWGSR